MTSHRDLLEARSFERRRLVTALLGGAPSGDAAPSPWRTLALGCVVAVLVAGGDLGWRLLR